MKHSKQNGFGIIVAIIIVAVIGAIGGGVYYSQKAKVNTGIDIQNTATVDTTELSEQDNESSDTISSDTKLELSTDAQIGSLRSLLSFTANTKCDVSSNAQGTSSTGTVYISGTSMRGDFSSTTSNSATVDSHMIKKGDTFHVWSGTKGAIMTTTEMSQADTQTDSSVSLDQEVNYTCSPWIVDSTKFIVPTSVTFVDISAMLNTSGGFTIPEIY